MVPVQQWLGIQDSDSRALSKGRSFQVQVLVWEPEKSLVLTRLPKIWIKASTFILCDIFTNLAITEFLLKIKWFPEISTYLRGFLFSLWKVLFSLLCGQLLFLLSTGSSLSCNTIWAVLWIHEFSILGPKSRNFLDGYIWWVTENVSLWLLFICDIIFSCRCSTICKNFPIGGCRASLKNTGPESLIHNYRFWGKVKFQKHSSSTFKFTVDPESNSLVFVPLSPLSPSLSSSAPSLFPLSSLDQCDVY